MNKPVIRIYLANGDFSDREMNDEEYNQHLKDVEQLEAAREAEIKAEKKRQAALTKLEALGLNLDDLKALGLG